MGDAEFIRPDKLWAHLSTLKNHVTAWPAKVPEAG